MTTSTNYSASTKFISLILQQEPNYEQVTEDVIQRGSEPLEYCWGSRSGPLAELKSWGRAVLGMK